MRNIAFISLALLATCSHGARQVAKWDFNGNLDASVGGKALIESVYQGIDEGTAPGTLTYQSETIGSGTAQVAKWVNNSFGNAYFIARHGMAPDEGGFYRNKYSFAMDIKTEFDGSGEWWQALLGTNVDTYNDADFYARIDSQSGSDYLASLGIGGLYSGAFTITQWHRVVVTVDTADTLGGMRFYVDGTLVNTRSGGGLDGTWALYTIEDYLYPQVILFGEGDTSGNYTNPILVNSVAMWDDALTDAEVAALGGVTPDGIETQSATVSGTVTLGGYTGDLRAMPMRAVLVDTNNMVVEDRPMRLEADGTYSVAFASQGTYDLYLDGATWLSKKVGSVTVNKNSVSGQDATLLGGDVDGDEVVSVFDYIRLSDAFDAVDGDATWDAAADVDGDGVISVFDYIILSDNFDKAGELPA